MEKRGNSDFFHCYNVAIWLSRRQLEVTEVAIVSSLIFVNYI